MAAPPLRIQLLPSSVIFLLLPGGLISWGHMTTKLSHVLNGVMQ